MCQSPVFSPRFREEIMQCRVALSLRLWREREEW